MSKRRLIPFLVVVITAMSFPVEAEASFFDSFFDRFRRRARPNLVEYVVRENERNDNFNTLIGAITAVSESDDPALPDLIDLLSNGGPFTVFAPTDDAFGDLGLTPDNIATALPLGTLADILAYHVTEGSKRALQLFFERDIEMLNGDDAEFRFRWRRFGFFINDARVIDANNRASNGIVHAIDTVLMPPMDPMPTTSSSIRVASVPEPSSLVLVCGLLGMLTVRHRR